MPFESLGTIYDALKTVFQNSPTYWRFLEAYWSLQTVLEALERFSKIFQFSEGFLRAKWSFNTAPQALKRFLKILETSEGFAKLTKAYKSLQKLPKAFKRLLKILETSESFSKLIHDSWSFFKLWAFLVSTVFWSSSNPLKVYQSLLRNALVSEMTYLTSHLKEYWVKNSIWVTSVE